MLSRFLKIGSERFGLESPRHQKGGSVPFAAGRLSVTALELSAISLAPYIRTTRVVSGVRALRGCGGGRPGLQNDSSFRVA